MGEICFIGNWHKASGLYRQCSEHLDLPVDHEPEYFLSGSGASFISQWRDLHRWKFDEVPICDNFSYRTSFDRFRLFWHFSTLQKKVNDRTNFGLFVPTQNVKRISLFVTLDELPRYVKMRYWKQGCYPRVVGNQVGLVCCYFVLLDFDKNLKKKNNIGGEVLSIFSFADILAASGFLEGHVMYINCYFKVLMTMIGKIRF